MWKKLLNLFSKPSVIAKTVEEVKPTYQDIDHGVLIILNGKFRCSKVGVECGSVDEQTVLKERALITRYRNWLKTQTDPCIISAYNHWLNFFANGVDEAEQAIRDNARAKWTAEWLKSREKFDKSLKFSQTLPRPEST